MSDSKPFLEHMTDAQKFDYILGETLKVWQVIEIEVKTILAAMAEGDFKKNYQMFLTGKEWTLGKTVFELKQLDRSDSNPFIKASDYRALLNMTAERNFFVHLCFEQLVYLQRDSTQYKNIFGQVFNRLKNNNQKYKNVLFSIQQKRIEVVEKFRKL